jgi:hypothetical protein
MNVSRQPYGKTVRLKCQADQFKGKSMRRMYREVVTFCHGLKLEAPVVSSENYLSLPQKRISEMASAAFIETQARALAKDAKDLPKIRRRVKRIVRKAIKNIGCGMPEDLSAPKKVRNIWCGDIRRWRARNE